MQRLCTKSTTLGIAGLTTLFLLTACPADDDGGSETSTGTGSGADSMGTTGSTTAASSTGGSSTATSSTGATSTGDSTTAGPTSGGSTDGSDGTTGGGSTGSDDQTGTTRGSESTESGTGATDSGDEIGETTAGDSDVTDTGNGESADTTEGTTGDSTEGDDEVGASESTDEGETGSMCDPGWTECDGECVDVLTDPRYCGADRLDCSPRGEQCDEDEDCARGLCTHRNRWNMGDMDGEGAYLDVGSDDTAVVTELRLVMDDEGRSVAGWIEKIRDAYRIVVAKRKAGPVDEQPWGEPNVLVKSTEQLSNFGLLLSSGGDLRDAESAIHATWVHTTDKGRRVERPHFRTWDSVGRFSAADWSRAVAIDNIGSPVINASSSTETRTARARNGDALAVFSYDNGMTGFNRDHNHEGWIDILSRNYDDFIAVLVDNPTDATAGTARRCVNPRIAGAKDGTITVLRDCVHFVNNVEHWRPWSAELDAVATDVWRNQEAIDKRSARSVSLRNGGWDVDGDGDGVALYHDLDDASLWLAYYDASAAGGERWSEAKQIGRLSKALFYDLAMNDKGETHVIWINSSGELEALHTSSKGRRASLSRPETISYTGLEVRAADLAITRDGRAMAVFTQAYPKASSESRDDLMIGFVSRIFEPDQGWRGFGRILSVKHSDLIVADEGLSVDFDNDGAASAAWVRASKLGGRDSIVSSNHRPAEN